MRIAIANNLMLQHLYRVLLSVPEYEIAWTARNGIEAVEKCASDPPDLLLMDPDMPVMDGVEATRRIMKETPCPILVVTATVEGNAAKVFEALSYGALDAVSTPMLGNDEQAKGSRKTLLKKIKTITKLRELSSDTARPQPVRATAGTPALPLIIIGSSTGGPKTLVKVLSRLPAIFGGAIVIVQHLDKEFSAGLADWLNAQTPLQVRLAIRGGHPEKGIVDVASTNDHLILTSGLTFAYTPEPLNIPYRPSVNVFFKSVSKRWPSAGIAVLLTGMGRDGAEGLVSLRQTGWHTIAQDQTTSVVYGMPKAAKELDAAVEILPTQDIAPAILQALKTLNIEY